MQSEDHNFQQKSSSSSCHNYMTKARFAQIKIDIEGYFKT